MKVNIFKTLILVGIYLCAFQLFLINNANQKTDVENFVNEVKQKDDTTYLVKKFKKKEVVKYLKDRFMEEVKKKNHKYIDDDKISHEITDFEVTKIKVAEDQSHIYFDYTVHVPTTRFGSYRTGAVLRKNEYGEYIGRDTHDKIKANWVLSHWKTIK